MITVVIPFYNSERYLKRAINSCLAQKEVTQLVLIDDNSTDNSNAIAEKLVKENPSIQMDLFKTVENLGPGSCRNMGVDLAQKDLITFLDADDFYLDNRFEKSITLLKQENSIDGVYAPFQQHLEKADLSFQQENFELDLHEGAKIKLDHFLLGNSGTVTHCGILFRKAFILEKKIQYGQERTAEDLDFLFDAIVKGNIVYSSDIVGKRCITGNNLTNKAKVREEYKVHKRWFKKMLNQDFSKDVNYYFLKNMIIKNPSLKGRKGFLSKILKGLFMGFTVLINPKLWLKL